MGFFSSSTYSTHEHHLPGDEIKKIIWNHLPYLKSEHKTIIETAIHEKRGDDKKISPEQIYHVLLDLEHQQEISKEDREEVMKLFVAYFTEHFN
jgi:DNA-binding PadR family transcriptional regulator